MSRPPLRMSGSGCEVVIDFGLEKLIGREVAELSPGKCVIITDEHVAGLYLKKFSKTLRQNGLKPLWYVVRPGESSKNRKSKEKIEDFLLGKRMDRQTVLIAFGGGVVGDLTGFVASTYLRGIKYFQIPTSLLAMVDSSIGGKTGVDTPYGKNMIGSFYQPEKVFVNLDLLKTLPEKEFRQGMAEVIKYSFIQSKSLYQKLFVKEKELKGKHEDVIFDIISRCIKIKQRVVGKDEKETKGLRRILNFGHTVGHGVEQCMRYKLHHGFCVSLGMSVETEIGYHLGVCNKTVLQEVNDLLSCYHLPTDPPASIQTKDLIEVMASDKKTLSKKIQLSLISEIGKSFPGTGSYATTAQKKLISKVIESRRLS